MVKFQKEEADNNCTQTIRKETGCFENLEQ